MPVNGNGGNGGGGGGIQTVTVLQERGQHIQRHRDTDTDTLLITLKVFAVVANSFNASEVLDQKLMRALICKHTDASENRAV